MELALAIAAIALLLNKRQSDPLPKDTTPPPAPLDQNGVGGDRGGSAGTADAGKILGAIGGAAPIVIGGVKAIAAAVGIGGGSAAAATSGGAAAGATAAATTTAAGGGTTAAVGSTSGGAAAAGAAEAATDVAVAGLSLAEGVVGIVYIALIIAMLTGLFVAQRRQRWTDWYGGIHKGPDGMRNRYRGLLCNWENEANMAASKRCPDAWWPNGFTRYDDEARCSVLLPPQLPQPRALSPQMAMRLGNVITIPPSWLSLVAIHRLFAVERLSRWNAVLFSFYLSRGWTAEQLETEGIAMTEGAFWNFIADELAAQRNADYLGYRISETSFAQLQEYNRFKDVQRGAQWSRLVGEVYAITRAGVDGWSFGWPGDKGFTIELINRCGLNWIYIGGAAGAGVMQHPQLPVFIDVVKSREQEMPFVIDRRTPQEKSEAL